jgi:hypothetical protein
MNWNDNPKPNAIDRVFVSQTESWEVQHFVDHYLSTNNYTMDENNRRIVRDTIKEFPGRPPVKRADLTAFLDTKFARK